MGAAIYDQGSEAGAGLVVHVVDDDVAVRESLEALLLVAGFDVQTYCSAEEFLAQASRPCGCLLLDVNMPGISGFDLLEQLAHRDCRVPVVLLTARRDEGLRELALARGASCFLNKPVTEDDLLGAIADAIGDGAAHEGSSV